VLQVKAILGEPTVGEMQEALKRLPSTLNGAIEETIQRIEKQPEGRMRLGMNVLMWITHAKRPLLVTELSDALAMRPRNTFLVSAFRPSKKSIIGCCQGLVVVDEENAIIRFVHYSVQEYFREHHEQSFPSGEQILGSTSLTCLMFDTYNQGCCQSQEEVQCKFRESPFVTYAARYWGDHVRNADRETLNDLALVFLKAERKRSSAYQICQFMRNHKVGLWEAEEAKSRNGLHMAAFFGLEAIGLQLLKSGELDIDSLTKNGENALMISAARGQTDFVLMLLGQEADPSMNGHFGTAMDCAAESGKTQAVVALLESGTDPNVKNQRGQTALHLATGAGHPHVMRALLSRGADLNAGSDHTRNVLFSAIVWEQSIDVLNILLEYGADIDARYTGGRTMLHLAAERNCVAFINLLLARGAPREALSSQGVTALYSAAEFEHHEAVQILASECANVDAADRDGRTPLLLATIRNQERIVQILLDAGADVATKSNTGLSALESAVNNPSRIAAQLVLRHFLINTPHALDTSALRAARAQSNIHTDSRTKQNKPVRNSRFTHT